MKIKLQGQPIEVLRLLLEKPGRVVTRGEFQKRLWPENTFVDFEHGLNAAVQKLREVLGDSANNPRFVETLPRRGYRFVFPVEGAAADTPSPRPLFPPQWIWISGAGLAIAFLLAVGLNVGGLRYPLFGGVAPGEITSIAVLPLDNLMNDPEQDWLVDGMYEMLITELSKISALTVISRTSAMLYTDSDKSVPEIARELGVDAIIEGSVLRARKTVRVTIQMVDGRTDRHLWADNFDREMTDIFALHSDVARAVAHEIQIALTPEEETRLAQARPVDPEAYVAYLKGRYHRSKLTEEGYWISIDYFQQAIARDPDYAPAYAGLAGSYDYLDQLMPTGEIILKYTAAVRKALELDDTLVEAHEQLAEIKEKEWDWVGAEKEYRRALELNPNEALTHLYYAQFLNTVGRHQEALAEAKRAEQLDPLSAFISANVIARYQILGEYDLAIEQSRKALELDPNLVFAHHMLGYVYLGKEMNEEAIERFQKAAGNEDYGGWALASLGYTYGIMGRKREALRILSQLKELSKRSYIEPVWIAHTYVGLGQKDEALRLLEKAQKMNELEPFWLVVPGFFDPLRDDPRFQELLRRMNLLP